MFKMAGLIAATMLATASMVGTASAQHHGLFDPEEHFGGYLHHGGGHGGGGHGDNDPAEHLVHKHSGSSAVVGGTHNRPSGTSAGVIGGHQNSNSPTAPRAVDLQPVRSEPTGVHPDSSH